MIWTLLLWFMLGVLAPTQSDSDVVDWPYVTTKNDYSEQSPVDIDTSYAIRRYLPFLRYFGYWAFNRATVNIANTGHTVCVTLANNSIEVPFITGGPLFDSRYEFKQMHFHWGKGDFGSEHKVNGYQYGMEVHIVHYKKEYGTFENAQTYSDGVCVVGFFGEVSPKDNREMDSFIADLKYITKPKSEIVRDFKEEFSWIRKTALKQHYYTYHGSLTTPPFTECVIWIIFTKPIKVSRNQLMAFRSLHSDHEGEMIKANDRSLQPFNNRTIVYGY
ncbi:carbonic anhydrase 7-like [Sipha flava]|uniref:Carbonic anhydrase n=1 Tax=Sipha flava TaxID=143950 RepID=A0A2S2QQS2_9HEMI|nr:carbonic anhydrase 7-like [Sipha flava]